MDFTAILPASLVEAVIDRRDGIVVAARAGDVAVVPMGPAPAPTIRVMREVKGDPRDAVPDAQQCADAGGR